MMPFGRPRLQDHMPGYAVSLQRRPRRKETPAVLEDAAEEKIKALLPEL